jgi:hypothetical protein
VTDLDIAGIEAAVGVTLPGHYRRFLLEHAETLRDARRRIPMRAMWYFEPEDIIWINKGLRDNPLMIEINEDTEPWPPNYFMIGTDGGGDYRMIDLNDEGEAFWKYDSEAGGKIVPADFHSYAEYNAALRRDLQEPRKWR